MDHPQRTAGLVVCTLDDPIDRSVAVEFQVSTRARPVAASFLDMVVGESLKVPSRVWRDAFEGLLKDDHADRLGSIAVPTLITWGDRDEFCPRSDQEALVAAIPPDARLAVYAGAGHALHWEEPQRYAADVAPLS